MPENNKTILRLKAHQLDQASEVLGRAFHNDQGLEYLVPNEAKRARLIPSFVNRVVHYCLLYGEVYTTLAVEGVACWLPPDRPKPPTSGCCVRACLPSR